MSKQYVATISRNDISPLYHTTISRNDISQLYFATISRNYISQRYLAIISRNDISYGNPATTYHNNILQCYLAMISRNNISQRYIAMISWNDISQWWYSTTRWPPSLSYLFMHASAPLRVYIDFTNNLLKGLNNIHGFQVLLTQPERPVFRWSIWRIGWESITSLSCASIHYKPFDR